MPTLKLHSGNYAQVIIYSVARKFTLSPIETQEQHFETTKTSSSFTDVECDLE